MKNYILLLLSFFVIFYSCSSKDGNKANNISTTENHLKPLTDKSNHQKTEVDETEVDGKESLLTLESKEKGFDLFLDSVTPVFNYHSQPVIINNEMKILWYNQENNSLDFYDLTSKALETRVQFQLNGPNALPGMGLGAGVKFVSPDSILLFSGPLKRIYLTDLSGKIYSKVELSKYAHGFGSVSMESPFAYRNGHIYVQIMPNIAIDAPDFSSPDYNRIAKIDLKTGEFEEFYIDPPSESKGVEMSQQLKMMDIIYNPKIDKFIISFPLSDKIIVTDFKNYKKEYVAKSSLVKDVIKLDPEKKGVPRSSIVSFFYWINSSYEKMIYDPINDLYFREARKGISEEAFKQRNFTEEREIIVLDSDFNKIGTFSFKSGGIYYYFFAKDYFFWNKDLKKFNLDNGVEDSLFFQGKELIF
ncbi:DUF4221 domain-containing protein [Algoriphagus sp. AGSA1]|uniref:DUF4221 family protein n=1 Tax=Algoriphagus sp. AGSA1 TaxID=2907213 RepID=UPI001F4195D6|nr:DUF4221 family protein [Algoriphagus sp. AGSA1]MCE7054052.1 DUF4221 domain-containing protein [Algoriphagus sp. AGSA1]